MISRASIAQLSQTLRRLRVGEADAEIVRWLRDAAPQVRDLRPPSSLDTPHGYTRSLLHQGDDFEILVLHWREGCSTPIHDHGGAHCWFAVAEGTMQVDNYLRFDTGAQTGFARIELEGREFLDAGGIDYRQDDEHLHRCVTPGGATTTLHLYTGPLARFNAFDEHTNAVEEITSSYDAIL